MGRGLLHLRLLLTLSGVAPPLSGTRVPLHTGGSLGEEDPSL